MSYDIISAQSYHETSKVVSPHVLFPCCLTLFLPRGNPRHLSKDERATRHPRKGRRLRGQSRRPQFERLRNRAPELSAETWRPKPRHAHRIASARSRFWTA